MFAPVFRPVFEAVFPSAGAAIPIWRTGGIASSDVAGVWEGIGAASLDASYLRLDGDQGYADIDPTVVGGVAPTWNAATGWTFNGTTQYLDTGIVPPAGTGTLAWSMIMAFSSSIAANGGCGMYELNAGGAYYLRPNYNSTRYSANGHELNTGVAVTSGVYGWTGNKAYYNGAADAGTIPAPNPYAPTRSLHIGRINYNLAHLGFKGNIFLYYVYKTAISADQMIAVQNAITAAYFP